MAAALSSSSNNLRKPAALGKIAAFHHHQRIARRIVQKCLEQIGQIVAGAAHPHHPPAAHHGDRGRFIGQPRRIGQQHRFAQIGDIEGIGEIGDHAFEQFLGAFLHQAGIGAKDQRRAQMSWADWRRNDRPRGL